MPRGVGTNRNGPRGAGYAACAGSGSRLWAAGVEGNCTASSRETGTVVAGVEGTAAADGGWRGCGAAYRQVRERVLVVAVGEHLGHSERMLIELSNAAPNDPAQKEVNISAEQRRAEDLLEENRMYRQTALQEGDAGLASVLDELERVLLDVAHSPEEVTPAQLEAIQKKIEARGILFKVRVVNKELQQRQEATRPAQNEATKRERNKV